MEPIEPVTEEKLNEFCDKLSDLSDIDDELDVPLSILKFFTRIWEMWVQYPRFNKAIKCFDFYNIYASMDNYFKKNFAIVDFTFQTYPIEPITEERLNQFHDKLANESDIDDDLVFARAVIDTFFRIWELWMKKPEFSTVFERENFNDIYAKLESYFKKNDDYIYFDPDLKGMQSYLDWCAFVDYENHPLLLSLKMMKALRSSADSSENVELADMENFFELRHVEIPFEQGEAASSYRSNVNEQPRLQIKNLKDLNTAREQAVLMQHWMTFSLQSKAKRIAQFRTPEPSSSRAPDEQIFGAFIKELPCNGKFRKYCSICACYIGSTRSSVIRHVYGEKHRLSIDKEVPDDIQADCLETVQDTAATDEGNCTWAVFIGETDAFISMRYCSVCNEYVFPGYYNVSQHVRNEIHWCNIIKMWKLQHDKPKKEPWNSDPFFREVDKRGRRYCAACYCHVRATDVDLKSHFMSYRHQSRWRQLTHNDNQFEDYTIFTEVDDRKAKLYCLLCCCYVCVDRKAMAEHIVGFIHQIKLQQLIVLYNDTNNLLTWNPGSPLGYPYIEQYLNTGFLFCSICACFLSSSEIAIVEHINTQHHKFQIEQVKVV